MFGVGGAGGNAVNNMIAAGLQGVDHRRQYRRTALTMSKAKRIIQMGVQVTEALAPAHSPKSGAPQPKRQSMRSAII